MSETERATHAFERLRETTGTASYGLRSDPRLRCSVCGIETTERMANKLKLTCDVVALRRKIGQVRPTKQVDHGGECWRYHHGCAVTKIEELLGRREVDDEAKPLSDYAERALTNMGIDPTRMHRYFKTGEGNP